MAKASFDSRGLADMTPCLATLNDVVPQRGRLCRPYATERRDAGPVCGNGWFGRILLRRP